MQLLHAGVGIFCQLQCRQCQGVAVLQGRIVHGSDQPALPDPLPRSVTWYADKPCITPDSQTSLSGKYVKQHSGLNPSGYKKQLRQEEEKA